MAGRWRPVIAFAALLAVAACGDESAAPQQEQPAPAAPAAARPATQMPPRRPPVAAAAAQTAAELGRVEGVVIDAGTDAPVGGFPVHVLGAFTADNLPLGETMTAPDGKFAFDGVPAGRARIVAAGVRDGVEQCAETSAAVESRGTATVRLRVGAAAAGASAVEVTGSVVWADTGEPVEKFEFDLWPPNRGPGRQSIQVTGTNGRFRVVLPAEGKWRTTYLVAGGERQPRFFEEVVAARGAEATLRVRRPGDAVLRVVDDATRAPIAGARAYEMHSGRDDPYFDPGHSVPGTRTLAFPPRTSDADGRIALGRGADAVCVFVVADGHAWSSLKAPYGGAPTEVRLLAGGSLRLSVPRWKELDAATVDTDVGRAGKMQLPPPGPNGEVRVEGLLPGHHTITVRRGKWFEDGVEYGHATVEIAAGAEARLTVDADPGDKRAKVAVTGTIVVSEDWGAWANHVSIDGAEQSNAEVSEYARLEPPASGRTMTFHFDGVPEGKYRLEVDPFQWRKEVVVGPGATKWTLDIGRPAEIVVKVVDDVKGGAVERAELSWYTLLEGQHAWSPEQVERRASDGAFVVHAPAGTVHLDASAPGFVDAKREVEAAAGATADVTLRLAGGATLIVRLQQDGKRFTAASPDIWVSRSMTSQSRSSENGEATFDGMEPGKCTVSARKLEGWTCDEQEVELSAGETKTVVLEVKEKP